MKKILVVLVIGLLVMACKTASKKEVIEEISKEKLVKTKAYPKVISEVLKKHGGINNWQKMKTLSFSLNNQEHTTDLHSRKTVINSKEYSLGFDGNNVWVSDTTKYKKDPNFYYNLYFYFYAMPFVLADDGIVYSETKPLEFEGKKYPGIKISYQSNVGSSPDDNYYMYYDEQTKEMSWLAYTVTYFSKETSSKTSIIRYNDWGNVNGFLLPKSLTWYQKDEKGNPTEPARKPTHFLLPLLNEASLDASFYKKPTE